MIIEQRRDDCNLQYAKLLESIRNKNNMSLIHSAVINLAESLVELGQISSMHTAKANEKAIFLIKLAKTITNDTKHSELYFQLTGEKMDEDKATFLEDANDAEDNSDDLVKVKKIPNVTNIPSKKNNSDSIKPETLAEYVGQERIKKQLAELIEAAKITNRPLEHILLFGSAGLGKTSLSKVIANEMNSNVIFLSGPTVKDPQALVDVIKDVHQGDIVFIDEIHRINPAAAEAIYTVMEDFELTYIDKTKDGSIAKHLNLPQFTIIGATTHSGLLEKPMRDRFSIQFKLDLYTNEELCDIARNWFKKANKTIDDDAAFEIARRSRGVPRICNGFIKRINVKSVVNKTNVIDKETVLDFFKNSGIDENGLQEIDIEYMTILDSKFGGKPVGIDNIAACLGEGKNIIENQVEPYLLYKGFIQITPSGRMLSSEGKRYLESKKNNCDVEVEKSSKSTEMMIENASCDDDLKTVASIMYGNIEENLIYKYKLEHKYRTFVIDYEEYQRLAKTYQLDGHSVVDRYDQDENAYVKYDLNVLETAEDNTPKLVECPPIMRFIKIGMNASTANTATKYWNFINKIRHKTPENDVAIANILRREAKDRKEMLEDALEFFKKEQLYMKD